MPMASLFVDLTAEVCYGCHISHCVAVMAGINALGIAAFIVQWGCEKPFNGIC